MVQAFQNIHLNPVVHKPAAMILYLFDYHVFLKIQMISQINNSHAAAADGFNYLVCIIKYRSVIHYFSLVVYYVFFIKGRCILQQPFYIVRQVSKKLSFFFSFSI